jgi:hypothetical protein
MTLPPKSKMIQVIASLKTLDYLSIAGFARVEDLIPITKTCITSLVLCGTPRHTDLSALSGFPDLRHLKLVRLSRIPDVSFLAPLVSLESFGLYYCPRVSRIDTLFQLPHLRSVVCCPPGNREGVLASAWDRLKQNGISTWP